MNPVKESCSVCSKIRTEKWSQIVSRNANRLGLLLMMCDGKMNNKGCEEMDWLVKVESFAFYGKK